MHWRNGILEWVCVHVCVFNIVFWYHSYAVSGTDTESSSVPFTQILPMTTFWKTKVHITFLSPQRIFILLFNNHIHFWPGNHLSVLHFYNLVNISRMVFQWNTAYNVLGLAVFIWHNPCSWRRKWQPTPVFLPGESQGQQSLVGCHLWGHTEADMTEAT